MAAARAMTFEAKDRRFVYAVARRIVANGDDAEDCAQEALLLAHHHRDSFRGDSHYHTWLYRIAATTALGHLRKQRRSRLHLVEGEPRRVFEHCIDPATSASTRIEEAEDRARLQQAISRLAPDYRDVLVARAEASTQEVANRLGISVANVKIRAHRARLQLCEMLARSES
jgi:RNA polymerase sigma-70 factor (ECF subfamily)